MYWTWYGLISNLHPGFPSANPIMAIWYILHKLILFSYWFGGWLVLLSLSFIMSSSHIHQIQFCWDVSVNKSNWFKLRFQNFTKYYSEHSFPLKAIFCITADFTGPHLKLHRISLLLLSGHLNTMPQQQQTKIPQPSNTDIRVYEHNNGVQWWILPHHKVSELHELKVLGSSWIKLKVTFIMFLYKNNHLQLSFWHKKQLPSNRLYKRHHIRQLNLWSLRCSWSIACLHCSNYIFRLDLTPSLDGLCKDNCKTRRESFKLHDLVCLTLETLQYINFNRYIFCTIISTTTNFSTCQ